MKKHKMRAKVHKKIRVLAFGTFDWLHAGHVHYLHAAKKLGDELIVIVARDENVNKAKGNHPVVHERARVQLIRELKCVDRAVLGKKGNIFRRVKELHPDVLALGYDQRPPIQVIRRALDEMGIRPKIVRLTSFRPQENKSSILRERVQRRFARAK